MRNAFGWGLIAIALLLSVGCSEKSKAEMSKAYDEGFKKAFKSSFMTSCTDSSKDETKRSICTCMVDDLLANFTTSELRDTDKMTRYIQENSASKCVNASQ